MGLYNCPRCGRLYEGELVNNICVECIQRERKDLKTVSEYLRKFPMANPIEVNDRTDVSVAQIMRFVKGGSLRISAPIDDLKCRLCGVDIKKGTLCGDCREKVEDMNRSQKKKK